MNKVILIGNVGVDPELRETQRSHVASFSLATTTRYKKGDEVVTETQWHNCTVWGAKAQVIEKYVKKGSRLCVEGSIKYESYEADGVKKYSTKILVENFELLGSKDSNTQANSSDSQLPAKKRASITGDEGYGAPQPADDDDDLPF